MSDTPTPPIRFRITDYHDGGPHKTFTVFAGPEGSGGYCGWLTMGDEEFAWLRRAVDAHEPLVEHLEAIGQVLSSIGDPPYMTAVDRELLGHARAEVIAALEIAEIKP